MGSSVRLTAAIREAVQNELILARFRRPVVDLMDDREALAAGIYASLVSRSHQKNFLKNCDEICYTVGGEYHRIKFNGGIQFWPKELRVLKDISRQRAPILRRLPYSLINKAGAIDVRGVLGKTHSELDQRKEDLEESVKSAYLMIRQTLLTVHTTGKLRSLWPEVGALLDKYEQDSAVKVSLPAPNISVLNEMLDLPDSVRTEKVDA